MQHLENLVFVEFPRFLFNVLTIFFYLFLYFFYLLLFSFRLFISCKNGMSLRISIHKGMPELIKSRKQKTWRVHESTTAKQRKPEMMHEFLKHQCTDV